MIFEIKNKKLGGGWTKLLEGTVSGLHNSVFEEALQYPPEIS